MEIMLKPTVANQADVTESLLLKSLLGASFFHVRLYS